jgi:hypothetical protein
MIIMQKATVLIHSDPVEVEVGKQYELSLNRPGRLREPDIITLLEVKKVHGIKEGTGYNLKVHFDKHFSEDKAGTVKDIWTNTIHSIEPVNQA